MTEVRVGGKVRYGNSLPAGTVISMPKVTEEDGKAVFKMIDCVACDGIQCGMMGNLDEDDPEDPPVILMQIMLGDGGLFRVFPPDEAEIFAQTIIDAVAQLREKGFAKFAQEDGMLAAEEADEEEEEDEDA